MNKAGIVLRVFFEDPFWIIWVERYVGNQQMISRNVIPKEFSDQEVYDWIMLHFHHLRFCSAGSIEKNCRTQKSKTFYARNRKTDERTLHIHKSTKSLSDI